MMPVVQVDKATEDRWI